MRIQAYIAGAGMTPFGKFRERGLKSLVAEAVGAALSDAGLEAAQIQAAYTGTAAAGLLTGQVMIPGQAVLRPLGLGRIPVVNCENACATSSTAFQQAATLISLGAYDAVLVVGFEKLHHADKQKTFAAFTGAVDVEDLHGVVDRLRRRMAQDGSRSALEAAGSGRSLFMDVYADLARRYLARSGATVRHFAEVAVKNARHGSLNPRAQFRETLDVAQVLSAPLVADPLTLPMCSPVGDGAAALVLVSERWAQRIGLSGCVRIRASTLVSGWDGADMLADSVAAHAARQCYEQAAVGPQDLDVVELHDASAPAELIGYEALGLAVPGEGWRLLDSGATRLGGRCPVSPSGGLMRKGHPVGATGCAQLVELADQLRGRCGPRQVAGARLALAENGGGYLGDDSAAVVVSVLERTG